MDDRTLELLRQRVESEQRGPYTQGAEPPSVAPDPKAGAVEKLRRRLETGGMPQIPMAAEPPAGSPSFREAQETGLDYEPPGLARKAFDRLLGLDVEDPMPWTRMGTTIVGGVAGGIAGSRVPGSPVVRGISTIAGSAAGTYVGAQSPERALQLGEDAGILPPGTREKYGLDDYELKVLSEGELLLDAFIGGGVAAVRAGSRGISNLLTGAATPESRAITEAATRNNIAMTPVMVGDRAVARGFVSVFGSFPWLTSTLKRRAQNTMNQIQTSLEGIPARFGPLATYGEAAGNILREATHTVQTINNTYEAGMRNVIGRAAANGVTVHPVRTRSVLDDIIRRFEGGAQGRGEIPRTMQGNLNANLLPKDSRDLYTFVNQLSRSVSQGTNLAAMGVRQVETLFRTIDQNIVRAAANSDLRVMQRWEDIRQALQTDMLTHSTSNSRAYPARQFVDEMHQLDVEMTHAMQDVLGPAAARMGFEASATGRTIVANGVAPRQSMEGLAKTLLADNSPDIIHEIARISGQGGVRDLTSAFMNEAVRKSFVEEAANVQRFDVDTFSRQLGLNDPNSARYRQVAAMLQYIPNGPTMANLQELATVARRASEANIPDVSTFIARRVALGGLKQGVQGALPIAAVAGATGAAAGSAQTGMIGGLIMVLGIRGLGNIISDPRSARALRHVFNEEATYVARRTATIRAGLWAIDNMVKQGVIGEDEAAQREQALNLWMDDVDSVHKKAQNR